MTHGLLHHDVRNLNRCYCQSCICYCIYCILATISGAIFWLGFHRPDGDSELIRWTRSDTTTNLPASINPGPGIPSRLGCILLQYTATLSPHG